MADREGQAIFMPSRVERVRFSAMVRASPCAMCGGALWVALFSADYVVFSADGTVIAEIDGLRLRRLDLAASAEIPTYYWQYIFAAFGARGGQRRGPAGTAGPGGRSARFCRDRRPGPGSAGAARQRGRRLCPRGFWARRCRQHPFLPSDLAAGIRPDRRPRAATRCVAGAGAAIRNGKTGWTRLALG